MWVKKLGQSSRQTGSYRSYRSLSLSIWHPGEFPFLVLGRFSNVFSQSVSSHIISVGVIHGWNLKVTRHAPWSTSSAVTPWEAGSLGNGQAQSVWRDKEEGSGAVLANFFSSLSHTRLSGAYLTDQRSSEKTAFACGMHHLWKQQQQK